MKIDIHHGEALDVMSTLPKHSIDALVTDPPYCSGGSNETQRRAAKGQGLRSEMLRETGWFMGDNMGSAGLVFLLRSIAFEATRVVKPTGSMIVFCDWRMLPILCPAIESAGVRYQALIVWDKGNPGLGTGFRPRHELAMHFTFGQPEFFSNSGTNVIDASRVRHDVREHQTQKPVELIRDMLNVVAPRGGAVLDPFCGSGSTGVAATSLGMDFVGIEREAKYVEIARRRIAAEAAQGKLEFT